MQKKFNSRIQTYIFCFYHLKPPSQTVQPNTGVEWPHLAMGGLGEYGGGAGDTF